MRNRLLNYRVAKARTIKVVDEVPREVYEFLVIGEKAMEFRAKPKPPEPTTTHGQRNLRESPDDILDLSEITDTSEIWQLPEDSAEAVGHRTDRYLQTALEGEALQKRLFYVNQQARAVLEEQGYTILYLALGFLEWKESSDAIQMRRAPLILVPVELDRARVGAPFKLRWTGEDILTNVSLKEKLTEQDVILPEFEMPEDKAGIDIYFNEVSRATAKMMGWQVVTDIYLDFFSFTKFVLYKDLDPELWPEGQSPAAHPLIKDILAPSDQDHGPGFNEDEVDVKLRTRDLYHVMDADPSQIAVIEDVKSGKNLVVEGPPGTGKSQTITNVIAELLAAGKSVLFVSEKMAALEVVKSRLDRSKLGNFCIELHSRKANKKEVLKELERAITSPAPAAPELDEKFDDLEALKSELNEYAQALREPFGKFGRSPYDLLRMREAARRHFSKSGRVMPRVTLLDVDQCGQKEWAEAVSALGRVAEALPLVRPVAAHQWRGCRPGSVLPSDEEYIGQILDQCIESLAELNQAVKRLVASGAVACPACCDDVPRAAAAAKVLAASQPVDRAVLLNQEWNGPSHEAQALIGKVQKYRTEVTTLLKKFKEGALTKEVAALLDEYKQRSAKFFLLRFFDSRYRYLKREIATFYVLQPPGSPEEVIADLEQLVECQKLREQIRQDQSAGQSLFASHWRAEESDAQTLQAFADWIVSFRQQLLGKALTEQAVDLVSSQESREEMEGDAEQAASALQNFIARRDALFTRVGIDLGTVFNVEANKIPLAQLSGSLDSWKAGLSRLQRWAQFVSLSHDANRTIAKMVVDLACEDKLSPEDIVPYFKGNFAEEMLGHAFRARPSLANFVGELHERKIERFMELDDDLIEANRKRLASKLRQGQPRVAGGATANSEAGILLGEFGRKRGHMPIRKLMTLSGGLIQKIKPCFMMSPLSIAQFLDPRSARFDVIVFDEASQVRPEDALGALLRGSQVVVMGDTRQLPPTSFFDRLLQDEPIEEEAATVGDVESILHQCKRSFPTKYLTWHYRSKHESLIAVSNQEFYDNKLRIYPSPVDRADQIGLQFMHLPDAIYDRGKSSVNRVEAQRVAEAALEHYRKYPDKSLGIGTFNIKQQQAILEEIELQLRHNPGMEEYFKSARDAHFFVKNLETIQGDERDVIFLSVGFGFDANRRLSLNFGPLNQEGGERRLNVLISRARERCVVFSNFRAADLHVDGHAPFGLRALKTFLDYAETRNLQSAEATGEDTDSPFEDSVYEFLRSRGYEVRKQIGCAGFRVDLAVVDPKSPGRYLLAIECDGAKYHSSPVARDRDRLRQQILEKLGWRIHRIWSTDWYRNRVETEERLIQAVELAKLPPATDTINRRPEPDEEADTLEGIAEDNAGLVPVDNTLAAEVIDYQSCENLGIDSYYSTFELHTVPTGILAEAVVRVVMVEGPVHLDEVVRRIRTLWGLRRAGQRIVNAVARAATYAADRGAIRIRRDFLWLTTPITIHVRRRQGDAPLKVDLICDEEIAEAMRLVLKHQFATSPDDLITQTARLFGFQALHNATGMKLREVLEGLIGGGELEQKSNGMIHFAPDSHVWS
jgi:very-short-patch-repair endonuclease/DNA polymerase III delta prime subunit